MDTEDDLRKFAASYVRLAKKERMHLHRSHLLQMAKTWTGLADRAVKIQAMIDREGVARIRSPH